jgi:2'-5' RNA ligase
MEEKELAHSLNIQLSGEITQKLKNEQEKLLKKFSERRFYDSSPHLAIATKFMGKEETDKFIKALGNEFQNDTVWELEFSDFKVSERLDYIFLHLSADSEQKLISLHERAFGATKNIGLEIQTGKKFRHFPYIPHISIIKLLPGEIGEALGIIKKDFAGVKMPVSCFEITRQADNERGFSDFPTINKINLLK